MATRIDFSERIKRERNTRDLVSGGHSALSPFSVMDEFVACRVRSGQASLPANKVKSILLLRAAPRTTYK